MSEVNREYFHWAVNCVLFIMLYAIFITQKELVKIEEVEIEKAVSNLILYSLAIN